MIFISLARSGGKTRPVASAAGEESGNDRRPVLRD